LSRLQRWLLWSSAAVSAASGLAYAAMRYLLRGDDPFSAYHHPLQPWALAAHVVESPLLLFVVGWFFGNHVLPKLQRRRPTARRTGLVLIGLVAVMTLSGYVLQSVSSPAWRAFLAWIHGASGGAFVLLLVGHLWVGRRTAPQPAAQIAAEPLGQA